MRRAVVTTLVLSALIACANGGTPSTVEQQQQGGDAGAGDDAQGPSVKVPPGSEDADHDGFAADRDCDDKDPTIHPDAKEVCNGKDDNCNGEVDEGFDADGDGYPTCDTPNKKQDCNDNDPTIHPGATEVCNDKDDNCDGQSDEGFDKDGDGFYACAHGGKKADCDDGNAAIHPGATEVCDTKDNDCSGVADDVPATLTGSIYPAGVQPHWTTAGNAARATSNRADLTQDVQNQAGALWWDATYLFDAFDVTSTFYIQQKSGGADGFTFAWVPGTNVNAVGNNGGSLGVYPLGGYGVGIDTIQNPGEPAAPFITIIDGTSGARLTNLSIPEVRDGLAHTLRVKLEAPNKVSVFVDGVMYVNAFAIAGYVPFSGHWGFTAATGLASEQHEVSGITMTNLQGCVP